MANRKYHTVKSHRRGKGKQISVRTYRRKIRPPARKRIIKPKPVKLYAVTDEYGQLRGFSKVPPKPVKIKSQPKPKRSISRK